MEKSGDQGGAGERKGGGAGKTTTEEGLPMGSSPYTQYKDLEDYKMQGYGAQGHQQPEIGRGAGGTDAPTPSGQSYNTTTSTDTINRQGVS